MSIPAKFARSATAHPLGKCSGEVRAPVPEPLAAAISGIAAAEGRTSAELVREILTNFLYGKLFGIRATVGVGSDSAPMISLDEAIRTLSVLHAVSPDEYRRHVLEAHVFGEFKGSMALMAERINGRNPT